MKDKHYRLCYYYFVTGDKTPAKGLKTRHRRRFSKNIYELYLEHSFKTMMMFFRIMIGYLRKAVETVLFSNLFHFLFSMEKKK